MITTTTTMTMAISLMIETCHSDTDGYDDGDDDDYDYDDEDDGDRRCASHYAPFAGSCRHAVADHSGRSASSSMSSLPGAPSQPLAVYWPGGRVWHATYGLLSELSTSQVDDWADIRPALSSLTSRLNWQ